jgi:hypothetical protein
MQLDNVRVKGDSLLGTRRFAGQPRESVAVAVSALDSLDAWRVDAAKTAGLLAGITIPVAYLATRPCFIWGCPVIGAPGFVTTREGP